MTKKHYVLILTTIAISSLCYFLLLKKPSKTRTFKDGISHAEYYLDSLNKEQNYTVDPELLEYINFDRPFKMDEAEFRTFVAKDSFCDLDVFTLASIGCYLGHPYDIYGFVEIDFEYPFYNRCWPRKSFDDLE